MSGLWDDAIRAVQREGVAAATEETRKAAELAASRQKYIEIITHINNAVERFISLLLNAGVIAFDESSGYFHHKDSEEAYAFVDRTAGTFRVGSRGEWTFEIYYNMGVKGSPYNGEPIVHARAQMRVDPTVHVEDLLKRGPDGEPTRYAILDDIRTAKTPTPEDVELPNHFAKVLVRELMRLGITP